MNTDTRLNALADGELDAHESELLLDELKRDANMQSDLCDTHLIKDLIRAAWPEEPNRKPRSMICQSNRFRMIAASVLLVAFGFLLGNLAIFNSDHQGISLVNLDTIPYKVVLYVGSSDQTKFSTALDKAESILARYSNDDVRVDIVASAGGVDLLRASKSEVVPRIRALSAKYDTVEFVACNNTIARLRRTGQTVDIIDEASVAPSAVQFVVNRLNSGWRYIAI